MAAASSRFRNVCGEHLDDLLVYSLALKDQYIYTKQLDIELEISMYDRNPELIILLLRKK